MAFTTTLTVDNLSLHAIVTPVACQQMTLRENAADAAPVAYDVAAPLSTNSTFRKYAAEATVFTAPQGSFFEASKTVGYIQPVSGTITFQVICE